MLKRQNSPKNELYKKASFNFFENNNNKICSPCPCNSQEMSRWNLSYGRIIKIGLL